MRPGAGQTLRLSTDLSIGIEGSSARARHTLAKGEQGVLRAVLGRGLASPTDVQDAVDRVDVTVRFWRTGSAEHAFPTIACGTPSNGRPSRSKA